MSNYCPKCGEKVDTQDNFDCPNCGKRFWQTKESFLGREIKQSFRLIIESKVDLQLNFWQRLIISPRFSEYFLKGFLSAIIFICLGLLIGLQFSENTGNVIIWVSWGLMILYWLIITIGYIYGYIRYGEILRNTKSVKKYDKATLRTSDTPGKTKMCPYCGEEIKSEAIICRYCHKKLTSPHFEIKLVAGILVVLLLITLYSAEYIKNTNNKEIQKTKAVTPVVIQCNDKQALLNRAVNRVVYPISRSDGGHGTGFAIDGNGIILTNYHVIEGTKKLQVWWPWNDSGWIPATVYKTYPDSDLALIKIDKPTETMTWADSNDLELSEELYAIGYPESLGGSASVTKGIYSRKIKDGNVEYLQTDTAINAGNSGGPLMNKCGIVGINTAKLSGVGVEGMGYAISSDYIMKLLPSSLSSFKDFKNLKP